MTAAGEATESRWLEGLDPVTERERRDVTVRAVWLAINENVGWGDRKTLLDIWQEHAPLPETGLDDGIYEALLAVARWGARRVAEDLATPDAITRAKAEAVANLVANIRTLHRPNPDCGHDGNPCCVDCEQIYPCLTVRLLPLTDPEESDRG